jgi:hypothetical protein
MVDLARFYPGEPWIKEARKLDARLEALRGPPGEFR